MKLLIATLCLAVAVAVSAVDVATPVESPVYDYHKRIGIPEATKIKKIEKDVSVSGQRIMGGSLTDISEVPYQGGLVIQLMDLLTSMCGACLISETRLLTAAHCQFDGMNTAQSMTVVLGSNTLFSGGVRTQALDVVMHPEWDPFTVANNIAVITINPVEFSDVISPIPLPSTDYEVNNPFEYWNALTSGYGKTSDDDILNTDRLLRSVMVFTSDNESCLDDWDNEYVLDSNLCALNTGNKGPCTGDAGGPLVVYPFGERLLAGVMSFYAREGCGYRMTVYTRVTSYLEWIRSI